MAVNPKDFSFRETDLKELVYKYLKHWKWFVVSVFICLTLAFLYNRYTIPEYSVRAKLQVLEDKSATSELAAFRDLDMFTGGKNKVEDEVEVLNSRSNFIEVVKELGLNVKMSLIGNVKTSEIYREQPITINFLAPDSVIYQSSFSCFIEITSNTTYQYREEDDGPSKLYAYGKSINTPIGNIIITPVLDRIEGYKGQTLKVDISSVEDVASGYRKKVNITLNDEFSNIVNLELTDPVPQKGIDILNSLIVSYNQNAIADKKEIADKTFAFINDRINDIYTNLASVDQTAQEFKATRGLTDIAAESNINLNVGAANQQELQNAQTQLNIASAMKDIVEGQDSYDILPSNVGLSDVSIANSTAKYNQLVQERNRLLKSSNEKNPMIVNIDQQLQTLKRSMLGSLDNVTSNLEIQVNNLSRMQSRINSRIYSAPKNERALRDITRQQQTTESLYLYLLQKREESQVALASSAPKSKTIDSAFLDSKSPVSPNKLKIFLASFIMGCFVPFSLIYTNDLLDNKIHNKDSLERLVTDVPILADLPHMKKRQEKLYNNDNRSVLAESFRIMRTNLDYLIRTKGNQNKNNVIFVTSSVPGEGKTFVSTNLAMVFASTQKRVLLVGADIRNPKIYTFFTDKNIDKLGRSQRKKVHGLTEYLSNSDLNVKDIITPMLAYSNVIDVIYSGKIPPNPAELLLNHRMKDLFAEVSEMYDYIIVDTAPLMVVSDTLLLSEYADHTIYVTRSRMTERRVVEFPIGLQKEGKIKGLCFVVNGVKTSNLGYAGRYGYGYGGQKKHWWSA